MEFTHDMHIQQAKLPTSDKPTFVRPTPDKVKNPFQTRSDTAQTYNWEFKIQESS